MKGAYVILFSLSDGLEVRVRSGKVFYFSPGFYAYCGSAKGSGGIERRVARHLKKEKKRHWHFDFLTTSGSFKLHSVWAFEGGSECVLFNLLLGVGDPVPGFGSTDCSCISHLLKVDIVGAQSILNSAGGKILTNFGEAK